MGQIAQDRQEFETHRCRQLRLLGWGGEGLSVWTFWTDIGQIGLNLDRLHGGWVMAQVATVVSYPE